MGIIARQSIKASIVGFIGVGIGAFTTLYLFPKFLTQDEIGIISTIQRASILLYSFMILGVVFSVRKFNKFNFKSLKYNYPEFLASNIIFLICSALVVSVIFIFFNEQIVLLYTEQSKDLTNFLYLPLFLAIGIVFTQFFFAVSGAHLRITIPNIINNVLNRLLVILAVLFYGFSILQFETFTYLYVILFYIIPLIGITVYIFGVLKVKIALPKPSHIKSVFKDTFSYNLFLYLTITSSIIVQSIDTLMISSIKGTSDTAVYTIAFFIATVIEIPQRMLIQVASPVISKEISNNNLVELKNIYKKSSLFQLFLAYSIFTLIWFNLEAIYQMIPNGYLYKGGVSVVLFIGLAKVVDIGFGLNKQIIEMSDYFKINLFINILLSVLVIALNLVFIPKYGINGAALASLLAISFTNFLSFLLVWYKSRITPFSIKTLYILIFTLLSYFLFYKFLPQINNPYMSITVNSVVIGFFILILSKITGIMNDLLKILKLKK